MGYRRGTRSHGPQPLRLIPRQLHPHHLGCRKCRGPDLLNLNLLFNKSSRWFLCTLSWRSSTLDSEKLLWPVIYGLKQKREPTVNIKNMNLKTVKSCCNFKSGAYFESILNSINWFFKKSNIFCRAWYISLFSVSQ